MFGQLFSCFSAARRVVPVLFFLLAQLPLARPPVHAQTSKIIVAYTSATSNFTGGWLAKLEGLFRKYNLDVELVLMQGPSTYLPALLSNNIQILYGGGTAVSRTIASGDAPIVVIGTETRYVPQRLMVPPSVKSAADLKGKKIGVSRGGLDEYAALYYLEKNGLVPGKDVVLVYTAGGVQARAAQMKQGLFDAMTVSPPNEVDLERMGFRELVNFFELRMGYAGIPYTVTREFRDKNPRVLTDFMTAIAEAIQIFRTNKEAAYKAIMHLTRLKDPILVEKIYKGNLAQYDAIQGQPYPWQEGIESMINGYHARFTPAVVKNRDARPFLDPSFVQRAVERLGIGKKQ
jgi:ABC-type nitrate/sulfonate/bicarbonate transport system substrate-binding protein